MPSHFIHLSTEEAAQTVDLSAFKDKRGETIVRLLLPHCGGALDQGGHETCLVMSPRIGTKDAPNKWIGWYHCSCDCHEFTETKDGWTVKPKNESSK